MSEKVGCFASSEHILNMGVCRGEQKGALAPCPHWKGKIVSFSRKIVSFWGLIGK